MLKYGLKQCGLTGSDIALNTNDLLNYVYIFSCFETCGCFCEG